MNSDKFQFDNYGRIIINENLKIIDKKYKTLIKKLNIKHEKYIIFDGYKKVGRSNYPINYYSGIAIFKSDYENVLKEIKNYEEIKQKKIDKKNNPELLQKRKERKERLHKSKIKKIKEWYLSNYIINDDFTQDDLNEFAEYATESNTGRVANKKIDENEKYYLSIVAWLRHEKTEYDFKHYKWKPIRKEDFASYEDFSDALEEQKAEQENHNYENKNYYTQKAIELLQKLEKQGENKNDKR